MLFAATTRSVWDITLSIGSLLVFVGLVGWAMYYALKKSNDPGELIIKWILSALVIGAMVWKVIPLVAKGGYVGAFLGVPLTATCGLILAIIWRQNIAGLIANPIGSLYDGGNKEADPEAFYSVAQARRKRGHYTEAIAEVRKQLERFPTDFTGHMLLAEIQAENMNDLPGAEVTIQKLYQQPGHAPRNIAFALNTLADWHLKYAVDRDAAQADLRKITELLPNSEFALLAEQRIGHLASIGYMLSTREHAPIPLPHGIENVGLLQSAAHLAPAGADPAQRAQELVRHLEQHPQDSEARERLAVIYADHFQRLDLAADQLQQLIDQPNQPSKNVIRWLNLLADLQIRHNAGYDAVAATLTQIIERFPSQAVASVARNRLDLLKLELKSKEAGTAVKLGTYEQNIGLKGGYNYGKKKPV
jgi:outer membrane protein assembly factor BamD (BamD/ComL family)